MQAVLKIEIHLFYVNGKSLQGCWYQTSTWKINIKDFVFMSITHPPIQGILRFYKQNNDLSGFFYKYKTL